jgi:signal transduction histidine kinase/HAMP domain-containing protein
MNRLALAVTAAVGAACLLTASLFWLHHYDNLSRSAQETARRQADLIRLALEHQMQENERGLIGEMVAAFARDPTIHEVRILDRAGKTRFSGGTDSFAPTCVPCHEGPGATVAPVSADGRGEVFRVILPIENRASCHECHDPELSVNGALLVDVRADAIADAVNRNLVVPILVLGGIALALLAAIAISLRVLILRRLEHFETAARAIAAGDLERRLPVSGGDTLSWMARAFNAMADSVMRLATELRHQRELLEMVIGSVDDGIAVLDRSFRFVAANEAFLARAPDRAQLTVPGAHCRDVLGQSCQLEICPAEGCFHSGERRRAVLTRVAKDGSTRLEELHASPIVSSSEVIAVVEVWRDITERRAAEVRMAEAHRMASLGMLASGFSHELNTPLATILTAVESVLRVLDEEATPKDERHALLRERARVAREQILRCRGITQQFLRLSRGQAASTDLVDLGPLVGAVSRLVEPTARESGVTVRCGDTDPGRAVVRASDAELQQVLLNLLLNAVQACPRGGQVEVAIEPGPPTRLLVRDDGCGIPADQLQKIFEPFYGLRKGGTGLGLFLSLAMARSWGADMEVKSAEGRGSTFEVRFGKGAARAAEA